MTAAVTFDSPLDAALLAVGVAATAALAWWYWRRVPMVSTRLRAAVVALRALALLLLFVALADPAVTRERRHLPRLRVVWDESAALDVADAPGGATRRDALAAALGRARAAGLDDRFEVVDAPPDDAPPEATLLVTDGAAAGRVARLAGAVAALLPARDPGVPDLSVVAAAAPRAAAPGAPVELAVTIRASRAAGRTALVSVSDATRVLASVSLPVSAADELLSTTLTVVPQGAGVVELAAEVAGVTGEVALADNRLALAVDLDSAVRRVLFVEGEPTWEGKFVRRALEEDPALRVDYFARVSRDATLAQPEVEPGERESRWDELAGVLADRARLYRYSAIVLGPLDASVVGEEGLGRVADFVAERGGGAVVLGGNGYAGSVLSTRGRFAEMLPAAVPPSSLTRREGRDPVTKGTVLLRPAGGPLAGAAFAGLGDDPTAALERLQRLGGDYLRLGPLKAGAEPVAVDASRGGVLVAGHEYGAGRALVVAPADTWRLAVGARQGDERLAAKFWSGLVGWVSARAEPPVALATPDPGAVAGEPVRLELTVRTELFAPVTSTAIEAGAARVDETAAPPVPLAFSPVAGVPGTYAASFVPPGEGDWTVSAAPSAGEPATLRLRVAAAGTGAVRDRSDPARFARFAAAVRDRGGDVVTSEEAERLAGLIAAPAPAPAAETLRPARHPAWAFLVPLLFCAEIFLRKRYGLD